MSIKLPAWNASEPAFGDIAKRLTAISQAINEATPISGGRGVKVASMLAGRSFSVDVNDSRLIFWPGLIVTNGPNGESDYTDSRYWVARAYLGQTGGVSNTDEAKLVEETDSNRVGPYTVTNVCEQPDETHDLPPNYPVLVMTIRGRAADSSDVALQHIFFGVVPGGPDEGFWAIIASAQVVPGQAARWQYPFSECTGQWTPDGTAQPMAGGRTGTAYNTIESPNPSNGVGQMGSGQEVTQADFDAGQGLQPIPSGTAVWVRKDSMCNSGSGSGTGGSGSGGGTGGEIYLFSAWNQLGCPV